MGESKTVRPWCGRATTAVGAATLLLLAAPMNATARGGQDGPADADPAGQPAGQVLLELEAHPGAHDHEQARFESPNGHATLQLHPSGDARGQISVNGRPVPEAQAALAQGQSGPIDVSDAVEVGTNEVEVRLVRGSATVGIDHPVLVDAEPEAVGVDPQSLAAVDDAVAAHAGTGEDARYTGAVVLVAHRGNVVHESAIGAAEAFELTGEGVTPLEEPRAMTTDTIFDQASITKVAATTAAVMRLVDDGQLGLDDRLGDHLPAFDDDKNDITVRQLLTHRSGLWEWQPTWLHGRGAEEVLDYLADLELRYEVGAGRHYSDIGYMLLAAIVESVSEAPFDDYVHAKVHEPLGMHDTAFTPDEGLRSRMAATSHGNPFEYGMIDSGVPYPVDGDPEDFDDWRDYTLLGEVNDGNSWYGWEGVAGHAGLFATARDLAVFGQTMVNEGGYGNHTLASPSTVGEFLDTPYDAHQAHGFWPDRFAAAGGTGGFGHGGFTGTEFAFDPDSGLIVVLLTNRQHLGEPYEAIGGVWTEVLEHALDAVDD